MEDFNAYQVPALKHYLCTKGITTSIYRKADLIKLCELAREIDLEDIQTEDDYVDKDCSSKNCRRLDFTKRWRGTVLF